MRERGSTGRDFDACRRNREDSVANRGHTISRIKPLLSHRAAPDTAGFALGDLTDNLLEPVVRMLRLLDRPQDIAVLMPMIEREILWRLINSELGTTVRQLGRAESRIMRVGRAIIWLRNHFAEPVRVEDLADMVEMSVTSFHRHFLGVTAMSPLQFQKQIRLQEARSRLLSLSGEVGAIGLSVG